MLKRHEIEILLKAGHSQSEVVRLSGVGLRSVRRIAKEPLVVDVAFRILLVARHRSVDEGQGDAISQRRERRT